MVKEIKLSEQQVGYLLRLYTEQPLSVDKLPYTTQFAMMVASFQLQFGLDYSEHCLYNVLIRLRKSKRLIRKCKNRVSR